MVVFAGIMSNMASEIGYVLLVPLSGLIFIAAGRHPILGMAAAFAGVSGGYSANLLLGTSYLRLVSESLDNHPVLASAAYNAGPGRARKWRADTPMEGAVYAETIPFSETRDYVKKVISNSVYYAALFDGRTPSIKSRLGVIPARVAETKGEDLP